MHICLVSNTVTTCSSKFKKKSDALIAYARSIALHIPVSAYHQPIESYIASAAMLTDGGGTRGELLPSFRRHTSGFRDSDVADSDHINHL